MLSCSIIHLSLHVFWIIYLSLHISCSIIYLSLHTCILDLCLHSHIAPCMHVTSIFGCSGPSFCYRYFAQCGFLTVALKDCLAFGATEFMLILSSHGGGHQGFGGDENTGRRHLLQANHDIQLVNFVLSCTCNFCAYLWDRNQRRNVSTNVCSHRTIIVLFILVLFILPSYMYVGTRMRTGLSS